MPNKFIPPSTTSSERTAVTPVSGELFYDSEAKKMYYGDGSTLGGVEISSIETSEISSIFISAPVSGDFILLTAHKPMEILRLRNIKTSAGSLVITAKNNSSPIAGLDNLNISSTSQTPVASSQAILNTGDELVFNISSVVSATNLSCTAELIYL